MKFFARGASTLLPFAFLLLPFLSPSPAARRRAWGGRRRGREVFGRDVGLDRLFAVVADADDDDGLEGVAVGVEGDGSGDAGEVAGLCEGVADGGAVERGCAGGGVEGEAGGVVGGGGGEDAGGVVGGGGEGVGRGVEEASVVRDEALHLRVGVFGGEVRGEEVAGEGRAADLVEARRVPAVAADERRADAHLPRLPRELPGFEGCAEKSAAPSRSSRSATTSPPCRSKASRMKRASSTE